MSNSTRLAAAACLWAAGSAFAAGDATPKEAVVTFTSTATVEVPRDWMSVTFSVTREGTDANAVQAALKQALDAALEPAQAAKKPDGHVEVQSTGFSLQPRYNPKGQMNGWSGTTELVVQGRDMAAIARVTEHVATMTIERLDYSVSREARERVEGDVSAQAIARFRARAADYAKAFGYSGYKLGEVNVQTDTTQPPPRPFLMKAMAAPAAAAPIPVEAGTGTVTATVNGSVQLQ